MKRPSNAALLTAAEWLDGNEGEGDEGAHCHAVAKWLRVQSHAALLRSLARKHGVSVVTRACWRYLRMHPWARLTAPNYMESDRGRHTYRAPLGITLEGE